MFHLDDVFGDAAAEVAVEHQRRDRHDHARGGALDPGHIESLRQTAPLGALLAAALDALGQLGFRDISIGTAPEPAQ